MTKEQSTAFISKVYSWLLYSQCRFCRNHSPEPICKPCQLDLPVLDRQFIGSTSASQPNSIYACTGCSLPLHGSAILCPDCLAQQHHFDRCISVFEYTEKTRPLLSAFKENKQPAISRWLADQLVKTVVREAYEGEFPQALIPVPTHWIREWWQMRVHGQWLTHLVFQSIQQHFGNQNDCGYQVPFIWQPIKSRWTRKQKFLKKAERHKNLKHSFYIDSKALLRDFPNHVAIVDDVMTTGATVNTMSRLLTKLGVQQIDIWCLARPRR